MLEESIAELTKAVIALTYALNQHPATSTTPVVVREPAVFQADPKPLTAAEIQIVKKAAEVPNEKPKTTTDTSPPSESESAPVSYDDVKKATNALSAARGRERTIEALSRFGVKRATELDEGQWADYIEYVDDVINSEA